MATYYIRTDGSDSNAGTGPATNQAWQTIGKIFASGTVVTGGDIVYIAPGTYSEKITVSATSPTSEVQIIGNPTASQFTGITSGPVKLSSFNAAGTTAVFSASFLISATNKDYYSFSNMIFEANIGGSPDSAIVFAESRYIKFTRCLFTSNSTQATATASMIRATAKTSTALDITVENCVFAETLSYGVYCTGSSVLADTSVVRNCLFFNNAFSIYLAAITASVYNCAILGGVVGVYQTSGSSNATITVSNSLFKSLSNTGILGTAFGTQTYNRFIACAATITNIPSSVTSTTTGVLGLEQFYTLLFGLNIQQPYTSYLGSPNNSFGTSSGAPISDLYGVTWSGSSPDAGAGTYRLTGSVSPYIPTERNASAITIAPGSTSQSIELYLGATGLTASTTGLSARYNRTRTASVNIPLVARTIAQAWTSGGFAEVDATNMPGVYRLDLPDAALAAGADDVTIVVRGASGTNGAVMTVKLSSGGLTSAQTAAAVLDAVGTSYATAGSIGYSIQNSNVASISGSTAAADELEGALLHNGTDYISAELVTPVTSAALVRMGPFEVRADGLGASDPLDIQTGAQHGIDIQCVDNNGSGIDITSATVTAKVYNSGATLVDTYACTATYAADGRAQFTIDTTVTNVPGTYTATITRTTGASDTQIFGPLRIYVRDI